LESFLLDRVDSTLNSVHPGVETALFPRQGQGPGPAPGADFRSLFNSIPGDCIEVRTLKQAVVGLGCIPQFGNPAARPGPKLPATVSLPASPNTPEGDRVAFFTVPAVTGSGSYRVRASIEAHGPNRILLIAAPLSDLNSTLHRLLLIELAVTAVVLAAMT